MPIVLPLLIAGIVLVTVTSMTTLGWILILIAAVLIAFALITLGGLAALVWKTS